MRSKILEISMLMLAFTVIGCAFDPIIDVATPTSISIRADYGQRGAAEATAVAEKHCTAYGKAATLISQNNAGIDDRFIFHCMKQ